MKHTSFLIFIFFTSFCYSIEINLPYFNFLNINKNNCEESYIFTSSETQYNHLYNASDFIELRNNYLVSSSNGNIYMKAGNTIVLTPDTHIQKGASFLAKIEPCCPEEQLDYPVFFTPNNDGINDYWKIKWYDINSFSEVYIFDRYGKLIKVLTSFYDFWDGTYNGENLFSTDYWFRTIFTDCNGNKVEYKSHFSLKR